MRRRIKDLNLLKNLNLKGFFVINFLRLFGDGILHCTPWFISNGTVQNVYLSADAEILGTFFCMAGKLRKHRKYSETNFYSSMIFHYQYLNLFRQSPTENSCT